MPPVDSVVFENGLGDSDRARAANLYFEAFRQKLGPILGDDGEALLAETFCLDRAIVARHAGEVVGLAGFHYDGRALVGIEWPDLRRRYGWLGGATRAFWLSLFERKPAEGELLMDGIVVAASGRGRGVGSELLRRIVDVAQGHGCTQVRLDVVDTNPGARRLYERHGFEAVKTESIPWLRRRFGFGASTTMVRKIHPKNGDSPLF